MTSKDLAGLFPQQMSYDARMDTFNREVAGNTAQLDINTPQGFSKAFFSGALGKLQVKLGLAVSFVRNALGGPRTSSPQPV